MNELVLKIYEDAMTPDGEEAQMLKSIKAGRADINILGVGYMVNNMETKRFREQGVFGGESDHHIITASRLFPVTMPDA